MKVSLSAVLMDINEDRPMSLEDGKEATLRAIIQTALGRPIAGDDKLTEDEKYALFRLGRRCKADEAHFSAKEVTIILKRVSGMFPSAYVYGQVKDLLDPQPDEQASNGADRRPPA